MTEQRTSCKFSCALGSGSAFGGLLGKPSVKLEERRCRAQPVPRDEDLSPSKELVCLLTVGG